MLRRLLAALAVARAAWTPQQSHRQGSWRERIHAEFEDSLRAYERVDGDEAAEALAAVAPPSAPPSAAKPPAHDKTHAGPPPPPAACSVTTRRTSWRAAALVV